MNIRKKRELSGGYHGKRGALGGLAGVPKIDQTAAGALEPADVAATPFAGVEIFEISRETWVSP